MPITQSLNSGTLSSLASNLTYGCSVNFSCHIFNFLLIEFLFDSFYRLYLTANILPSVRMSIHYDQFLTSLYIFVLVHFKYLSADSNIWIISQSLFPLTAVSLQICFIFSCFFSCQDYLNLLCDRHCRHNVIQTLNLAVFL